MGDVLLAACAPETLVAVGGPGSRTLGELLGDAGAVARALPEPEPGAEVLLYCEDRYRFAAGLLGAWARGFAVALPPNAQDETLRLLASREQTRAFLHDHDGAAAGGIDLRPLLARGPGAPALPLAFEPSRHLVTVYTSGSTGPYQPCRKTAAQLLGEAALQARTFGVTAADRFLATVPPHHIYGLLFGVLVPLTAGAAFVRTTPFHAEAVAAELRTQGATVLVSVPAHLRSLALLDAAKFRGVRLLLSSAGALDSGTQERISHLGPDAFEILGSSETGGIATRRAASGAGWRPLAGVRIEAGEAGQLLLDSPFLEAGLPRPHPCADRIALLGDGSFQHLGRLDDVVKVAGKRVALSDVEARLRAQPGVTDAAVLAVDSPRHGTELRVVAAGPGLDAAALRQALLLHFDATIVPRQVHVLAQLPSMENGKLARARLLELTGGGGNDLPARWLDGEGDARRFEVEIRADLPWFRGHFDGFPILPGVVQLELIVVAQIRRSWPELGAVRRLTRVKFRRPVRPGQTLVLALSRAGAAVTYSLSRGGEVVSSGTLELQA